MAEEQYISIQEACDILGLANPANATSAGRKAGHGRNTIYRYIHSGELEATNLGGRAGYRIRLSELERFMRERAQASRERAVRAAVSKEVNEAIDYAEDHT